MPNKTLSPTSRAGDGRRTNGAALGQNPPARRRGGVSATGARGAPIEAHLALLLSALRAVEGGDFSVRLSPPGDGARPRAGGAPRALDQIARTFNSVVGLNDRPNVVGNWHLANPTVQEWFNTKAFQQLNPTTQAGQFGNAGRNIVTGPPLQDWDFSLFKNIPIRETKSLQFRAEFFNFFNHANFRLPDNDISSPTFGQITEAQPGRTVQLALKFLF